MNKLNKISVTEIPFHSFEKLGLSKMDVLKLDKENLEALLSGKRTGLLNIKGVDGNGEKFDLNAKVSLNRNPDNTVGILIHPIRQEIKNDINLNSKEIGKLKDGSLVSKTIEGERYLIQLDKETNELLKIKTKNINVPSHIKDVELNSNQKEKLKQGQVITLESGKEKLQVGIDLNNPRGLKLSQEGFEKEKQIKFDRENPHINTGADKTDKNRAEFIDFHNKSKSSFKLN